jgi:hypothetical protein
MDFVSRIWNEVYAWVLFWPLLWPVSANTCPQESKLNNYWIEINKVHHCFSWLCSWLPNTEFKGCPSHWHDPHGLWASTKWKPVVRIIY